MQKTKYLPIYCYIWICVLFIYSFHLSCMNHYYFPRLWMNSRQFLRTFLYSFVTGITVSVYSVSFLEALKPRLFLKFADTRILCEDWFEMFSQRRISGWYSFNFTLCECVWIVLGRQANYSLGRASSMERYTWKWNLYFLLSAYIKMIKIKWELTVFIFHTYVIKLGIYIVKWKMAYSGSLDLCFKIHFGAFRKFQILITEVQR